MSIIVLWDTSLTIWFIYLIVFTIQRVIIYDNSRVKMQIIKRKEMLHFRLRQGCQVATQAHFRKNYYAWSNPSRIPKASNHVVPPTCFLMPYHHFRSLLKWPPLIKKTKSIEQILSLNLKHNSSKYNNKIFVNNLEYISPSFFLFCGVLATCIFLPCSTSFLVSPQT